MAAYYNEFDPFAAQWLRNLIAVGLIADGDVDDRSIVDVTSADLKGYTQCHFFAGLGGWSHALRLAGWPDDRPVWTGSPPCQPFSNAGKQLGKADERHLAPIWLRLVSERRPSVIFGEQVEAAIRKDWLDDLQDHMEAENYACAPVVLPACGVGAPHIRQRLWFVAERLGDADSAGLERFSRNGDKLSGPGRQDAEPPRSITPASRDGGLADAESERGYRSEDSSGTARGDGLEVGGANGGLADADCGECNRGTEAAKGDDSNRENSQWAESNSGASRSCSINRHGSAGPTNGFWRDADWLFCRDGKWRPVEPDTFPLADGVPARVGRLRAYGNAIVPQVATQVIEAFMEIADV